MHYFNLTANLVKNQNLMIRWKITVWRADRWKSGMKIWKEKWAYGEEEARPGWWNQMLAQWFVFATQPLPACFLLSKNWRYCLLIRFAHSWTAGYCVVVNLLVLTQPRLKYEVKCWNMYSRLSNYFWIMYVWLITLRGAIWF